MMYPIEQVVPAFSTLLQALLDKGHGPPFYFAAIASNGFTMTGRFLGKGSDLEPTVTSEVKNNQAGLALPINLFVVTTTGEVARLSIDTDGQLSGPQILHRGKTAPVLARVRASILRPPNPQSAGRHILGVAPSKKDCGNDDI